MPVGMGSGVIHIAAMRGDAPVLQVSGLEVVYSDVILVLRGADCHVATRHSHQPFRGRVTGLSPRESGSRHGPPEDDVVFG